MSKVFDFELVVKFKINQLKSLCVKYKIYLARKKN